METKETPPIISGSRSNKASASVPSKSSYKGRVVFKIYENPPVPESSLELSSAAFCRNAPAPITKKEPTARMPTTINFLPILRSNCSRNLGSPTLCLVFLWNLKNPPNPAVRTKAPTPKKVGPTGN